LETECNLNRHDAIALMSIAGNLQISQVVDPLKTARFEMPLSVLTKLGYRA
jgi:amidase